MTPVIKTTNNSHVSVETLKAFNAWINEVYNCKIGYIDKILCYRQYAAETAWQDTTLSVNSVLNNIPIYLHRIFVQYLRDSYERRMVVGDVTKSLAGSMVLHQSECRVNLRTNETIGIESGGAGGGPVEVKSAHGEVRIPIPEGYDGNTAFVELIVPFEVVNLMTGREIGDGSGAWTIDAALTHPLADTTNSYVNANYHGWMRPHALLFYQRYTRKNSQGRNILKIDVAKSKNWVSIRTHADLFTGPFATTAADKIEPWVEVKITCYKYGAR